jgi:(E)-4-hydroxy-3-methylbut-2-enyl-diphosphate synthase
VRAAAPPARGKEPPADAIVADGQLWFLQAHSIPGAERCQGKLAAHSRALAVPAGQVPLVHLRTNACVEPPTIPEGALVLLRLGDDDPAAALRTILPTLPEACLVGIAEPGLIGETRAYRLLAAAIEERFRSAEAASAGDGRRQPIAIALPFQSDELAIAAIAGGLLVDGIGDALYFPAAADPRRLAFTLLQAVKARVTRADYVACPSCGRTQFDLMEVTAHIKAMTSHLDGVTIAIMGCIVNGPGEMADADFGYVGSGPGKIDLYRGREKVRSAIPAERARDELLSLIREAGMWKDPQPAEPVASSG